MYVHVCSVIIYEETLRKNIMKFIINRNITHDKMCVLCIDSLKEYLDIIESENSVHDRGNENNKVP